MKEEDIHGRFINARTETVDKQSAFQYAFRNRRCLIVASSFFEWRIEEGSRQPYLFQRSDRMLLALAGVWEHWENQKGRMIASTTILTTDANTIVSPIHGRMPFIVEPSEFSIWLDVTQDSSHAKTLLLQQPTTDLECFPVSKQVNNGVLPTS
jgi:putative SOS response-associated peptidase YedK